MDGLNDVGSDILFYIYSIENCDSEILRETFYNIYGNKEDVDREINHVKKTPFVECDGRNIMISDCGKQFVEAKEKSTFTKMFEHLRMGYYKGIQSRIQLGIIKYPPSSLVNTSRSIYYQTRYGVRGPNQRKIQINPINIKYRLNRRMFFPKYQQGIVKGGDWDYTRTQFESHPIYRGLHQRFEQGKPWEETLYYEWAKLAIETRGSRFGCSSMEEFLQHRCSYVDRLYESIAKEGYKRQKQAKSTDESRSNQDVDIGICVDRDGQFLLYDGHHRMTIARLLSIDSVYADVLVEHQQWKEKEQNPSRSNNL